MKERIDTFLPWLLSWEGGYVNDPHDRGGATNKGVTITTWRSVGYDKDGDGDIDIDDLRLLTDEDVRDRVLRPHYWAPWQADKITSRSVAHLVVDWAWASGTTNSIKRVQRALGIKADGKVGPQTLGALNKDPRRVFGTIMQARRSFIESICARDKTQLRFRAGWLRRLESIQMGMLKYNGGRCVAHPA